MRKSDFGGAAAAAFSLAFLLVSKAANVWRLRRSGITKLPITLVAYTLKWLIGKFILRNLGNSHGLIELFADSPLKRRGANEIAQANVQCGGRRQNNKTN